LESGAHVQKLLSHLFLRHTQQQVDILITKNGFHTLKDLVIADPTHTDVVQRKSMKIAHASTMATQKKTRSISIKH
jgi:RNA:NAD 2'-phosphotransferase (TPT1/KptA family)